MYRARDSKLKRDVAIKVPPDGFALDRERVARFEREFDVAPDGPFLLNVTAEGQLSRPITVILHWASGLKK